MKNGKYIYHAKGIHKKTGVNKQYQAKYMSRTLSAKRRIFHNVNLITNVPALKNRFPKYMKQKQN